MSVAKYRQKLEAIRDDIDKTLAGEKKKQTIPEQEQAEAQRLIQSLQEDLQTEQATPVEGEEQAPSPNVSSEEIEQAARGQ